MMSIMLRHCSMPLYWYIGNFLGFLTFDICLAWFLSILVA